MAVSPQRVTELADLIVDAGSVAEAVDILSSSNATPLELSTFSAAATLSSMIIPNQGVQLTMSSIGVAFAAASVGQEAADGEFTWGDVAALSALIGAELARSQVDAAKFPAAVFSGYALAIPYLNEFGYTYGADFLWWIDPLGIIDDVNTFLLRSKNWTPPRTDPLVLDLDNDGIETVGIGSTVVVFDHDGDGIKTGTGWVVSDDGFLVMVLYNTGDSIASVAGNSIISGTSLGATDKIAFTNGVDVITDFTAGIGGDIFVGANAGIPTTGIGVPLLDGFAIGTTYFVSGAWAGNIFTIAADGVGADTMIIEGSGVEQGLIEDYVILVGVDSDDIVAANFI